MEIQDVKDISAPELRQFMDGRREESYLLIDVRQPKEYRQFHIPGAVLLPLKEVETGITRLPLDRDLVFYCRTGRRSRIAASLVADMGIPVGRLLNLAGGILSWQGKKLRGLPRVGVFRAAGDLFSTLQRAFELERGTQNFYTNCARVLKGKDISGHAMALADFEAVHAKVIYSYMKRFRSDLAEFEQMFEKAPGDILEGGLSVAEAVVQIGGLEGDTCINFAEMALEIEFMAYDLYKNLASVSEDREIIRAMMMLSEQEKGHVRIVADILSECLG